MMIRNFYCFVSSLSLLAPNNNDELIHHNYIYPWHKTFSTLSFSYHNTEFFVGNFHFIFRFDIIYHWYHLNPSISDVASSADMRDTCTRSVIEFVIVNKLVEHTRTKKKSSIWSKHKSVVNKKTTIWVLWNRQLAIFKKNVWIWWAFVYTKLSKICETPWNISNKICIGIYWIFVLKLRFQW